MAWRGRPVEQSESLAMPHAKYLSSKALGFGEYSFRLPYIFIFPLKKNINLAGSLLSPWG